MANRTEYLDIYKSLDYGPIATCRGLFGAIAVTSTIPPCDILCIGSGNSYESVWLAMKGFNVTTYDYYHPSLPLEDITQVTGNAKSLPFKSNSFDLVLCCELLEHIPESDIDLVLSEINRIAHHFELTVDTEDDPPYHTHICIKPKSWWQEKLSKHNFKPSYFDKIIYQTKFTLSDGTLFDSEGGFENRGYRITADKVI